MENFSSWVLNSSNSDGTPNQTLHATRFKSYDQWLDCKRLTRSGWVLKKHKLIGSAPHRFNNWWHTRLCSDVSNDSAESGGEVGGIWSSF
jgi:hypothetical protein